MRHVPRQPVLPPRGEGRVKECRRQADRWTVTEYPSADRRAPPCARRAPGPSGRAPPAGCGAARWAVPAAGRATTTGSPTGCATCASACCSARSRPSPSSATCCSPHSPGPEQPGHPRACAALVIVGLPAAAAAAAGRHDARLPRPDDVLPLEHRDQHARRHRHPARRRAVQPAGRAAVPDADLPRGRLLALRRGRHGRADDGGLPVLRRAARPHHVGPVLPGDHGRRSRWSAPWRRRTRGPPTTVRCC